MTGVSQGLADQVAVMMLRRMRAVQERGGTDERILSDPVRWVRDRLHHDPWDRQEEIIDSVFRHQRTTVRSAHGVGKSYIAADCAAAFFNAFDDAVVITTAPTQRQVRTILWGYLRSAYQAAKLPGVMLRTEWRISDRHYALGFATKEPEQFQGIHAGHLLIIVDEASGMEPGIEDAIEGALAGGDTHLLLIGNPTRRSGMFYESHTSRRHLYHTVHLSAMDSPEYQEPGSRPYLVGKAWADERREEWGEDSPLYQVRVLGQFPDQDEMGLVPVSWLDLAEANDYTDEEDAIDGPYSAALDVARYGSDENVLYLRRGWQVKGVWAWNGIDLMRTVARTQEHLSGYQARLGGLWVDTVGLGAGVGDRLRELGWPVHDFVAGATPTNADDAFPAPSDEAYYNLRAEAFWNLRRYLRDRQVGGLSDGLTQSQLTTIQYKMQSDKKILIESKDQMRKRGLRSPDRADALAMCFMPFPHNEVAFAGVNPDTTIRGRSFERGRMLRGRR